ncbi:MAG TPA: type 4a pilus biogenesis protein PilO [Acidimicrobiales bacterium]|nr:type 4a pilus biogenesis protein PilO [Acidimicrobiales bacterium]
MTRRNMLIAGAVAGVLTLLWYVVLWSPRKVELSHAKDRVAKADALREELQTKVARLQAAQKDEPAKRAQLDALRTTIPDDPNLAGFILDTNDAATKAGIDFISIAPTAPAPPTPVPGAPAVAAPAATAATGAPAVSAAAPAEVKMQLQITGGYFQVLDFLNRINDLPRLVISDGLTINAAQDAKLTVGLTARMFVRAVPPGFGNVPLATTPTTAPATANASATTPAAQPTASAAPAAPASTTSGGRS